MLSIQASQRTKARIRLHDGALKFHHLFESTLRGNSFSLHTALSFLGTSADNIIIANKIKLKKCHQKTSYRFCKVLHCGLLYFRCSNIPLQEAIDVAGAALGKCIVYRLRFSDVQFSYHKDTLRNDEQSSSLWTVYSTCFILDATVTHVSEP